MKLVGIEEERDITETELAEVGGVGDKESEHVEIDEQESESEHLGI